MRTWSAYAVCTLGLGFVATMLPDVLARHQRCRAG
jgi:hypothetical protein